MLEKFKPYGVWVNQKNKMVTKKVNFLEIKKGIVKFNCGYKINDGIERLLFPNLEFTKEFHNSYDIKLRSVITDLGQSIFNYNDVEISTWYPLNGRDEYSLVDINYDKITNIGIGITFNYFIKFLERKIVEYSNLKNLKLEKSIEIINKSICTLSDSESIFCKILFKKYWDIVFDDSTLCYTYPYEVRDHIRNEWDSSIEIEELRVKFMEKVDELCSSSRFSKSESQKIIIEHTLQNVINELNEFNNDSQFNRRLIQFNELNESKLNLEKIKSLI